MGLADSAKSLEKIKVMKRVPIVTKTIETI